MEKLYILRSNEDPPVEYNIFPNVVTLCKIIHTHWMSVCYTYMAEIYPEFNLIFFLLK